MVISPVSPMSPVPVILFEFKSRLPPSCGEVSFTMSESPPLPPAIVIVFVEPVPDATTPEPTKLIVDAAVDNAEPSSCTVICPPTVPGSH